MMKADNTKTIKFNLTPMTTMKNKNNLNINIMIKPAIKIKIKKKNQIQE